MNPYKHAELSVKRRGGVVQDYLHIHDLIDSTKELCSDNRHRFLHTLWGIKRIVLPVVGRVIVNSKGKTINVKDLCEQDHVLADYKNRFIPTLSDFTDAIEDDPGDQKRFNAFFEEYKSDQELTALLLSPLANTGRLKSLYFTHNSWFINEVVPKVLKRSIEIKDFGIRPADFFEKMQFELWMDNGAAYPRSAKIISEQNLKN